MNYNADEIIQYVLEEDVKFIRLAFCDVFGRQRNISIMPTELERAFRTGITIDASSVNGFGSDIYSDLLLHPDPDTLSVLPWRPEHGRVVRMFCTITHSDGKPFDCDTRALLIRAIEEAKKQGLEFDFGSSMEFYLFKTDEEGERTYTPYDNAGYMDIAPDDKGENIRREICLTLEQMGIFPESSYHEKGPGQNEIDFRYADALSAADNTIAFQTVVRTCAARNGVWADFSPKPLNDKPGNGFHINISISDKGQNKMLLTHVIAGIMEHIGSMTLFLDPTERSYERLGSCCAPKYITWSSENRSQLIRIPSAIGVGRRAELRSPDPLANPYLAFALMIYAALDGVKKELFMPKICDFDPLKADEELTKDLDTLPDNIEEAKAAARESKFIASCLPKAIIDSYCGL